MGGGSVAWYIKQSSVDCLIQAVGNELLGYVVIECIALVSGMAAFALMKKHVPSPDEWTSGPCRRVLMFFSVNLVFSMAGVFAVMSLIEKGLSCAPPCTSSGTQICKGLWTETCIRNIHGVGGPLTYSAVVGTPHADTYLVEVIVADEEFDTSYTCADLKGGPPTYQTLKSETYASSLADN